MICSKSHTDLVMSTDASIPSRPVPNIATPDLLRTGRHHHGQVVVKTSKRHQYKPSHPRLGCEACIISSHATVLPPTTVHTEGISTSTVGKPHMLRPPFPHLTLLQISAQIFHRAELRDAARVLTQLSRAHGFEAQQAVVFVS